MLMHKYFVAILALKDSNISILCLYSLSEMDKMGGYL